MSYCLAAGAPRGRKAEVLEREQLCVELKEEREAPWIWERSSVGEKKKRGAGVLRGEERGFPCAPDAEGRQIRRWRRREGRERRREGGGGEGQFGSTAVRQPGARRRCAPAAAVLEEDELEGPTCQREKGWGGGGNRWRSCWIFPSFR